MKTQNTEVRNQKTEQPFGVNYTWADSKGRMHLGRSVGSGRDRAHAERRFFRQHRHVMAEDGFTVFLPVVIIGVVVMLGIIVILSVQLERRNNQLSDAQETARYLREDVDRLANAYAAIPVHSFITTTNGGAK
jgi:hypothetical protein